MHGLGGLVARQLTVGERTSARLVGIARSQDIASARGAAFRDFDLGFGFRIPPAGCRRERGQLEFADIRYDQPDAFTSATKRAISSSASGGELSRARPRVSIFAEHTVSFVRHRGQ